MKQICCAVRKWDGEAGRDGSWGADALGMGRVECRDVYVASGLNHDRTRDLSRSACGARVALPVENLLERSASGISIEEIIEDHPDLERDDLLAALEFGALASGQLRAVPLAGT